MSEIKWQCRWSPTLGELESTHQEVWGTDDYTDIERPTVFFGVYGLPDLMAVRQHKGRKAILWAGTDIAHLIQGYWLDDNGAYRVDPYQIGAWLNFAAENWCENEVEQAALRSVGIEARVGYSYLGDIDAMELSYAPSSVPKVYASVSGDNFAQYGWHEIEEIAPKYPDIQFHLFGNVTPWLTKHKNVVVHGRVSKEKMNESIRGMQGALRLLAHDGFSEVLAKSVLMGQWPVSRIAYPHMLPVAELHTLKEKDQPNVEGREYYRNNLNLFPWSLTS